jgi:hypothetical protein
MTLALVRKATTLVPTLPCDHHPAAVYIARVGPGSRRTMRQALNTIAQIITAAAMTPKRCPGRAYATSIRRQCARHSWSDTRRRRPTRCSRPSAAFCAKPGGSGRCR